MWSGAHGSTHDSGERGPGFDPTPKPRTAFIRKLSSPFFLTTDLKTIVIYCDVKLKLIILLFNRSILFSINVIF